MEKRPYNWVIVSTERGRRPLDYKIKTKGYKKDSCVFCKGNEGETPPEVFAFREKSTTENKPRWKVRVVSNKYPALKMEEKGIILQEQECLKRWMVWEFMK